MADTLVQADVFTASRWTRGNWIFPVRIEVTAERVTRVKPKFIGSEEESISLSKIASVSIRTGLFWGDVRIDSSGGTNPITSHGHRNEDVRRIRDLVDGYQQRTNSTA